MGFHLDLTRGVCEFSHPMNSIPAKDREILRELGRQTAEAAADPVNAARQKNIDDINRLRMAKPWIAIYQEPWPELDAGGELDVHCKDDFCRGIELEMRRMLYRWRHYPGDMIMPGSTAQGQCIIDSGFGIRTDADTVAEPGGAVASHHFNVQISEESDIDKIKPPVVSHDRAKTEELFQKRCEIFDGVLPVTRMKKGTFWFAPWDQLVEWTGIQEVLMDMALRPEYVHKLISRLVDCWMERLRRYEELDLFMKPPAELEVFGAAQVFSEVSPEMHGEFALRHEARFLTRFKTVVYGCCEPLHNKVDVLTRHLPNLHKISMSPWIDFKKAAENVKNRFVFVWKPNPAVLAYENWNPADIRRDMKEKLSIARANGCVMEIHLKDLSTIRNQPQRLTDWNRIAQECAGEYV